MFRRLQYRMARRLAGLAGFRAFTVALCIGLESWVSTMIAIVISKWTERRKESCLDSRQRRKRKSALAPCFRRAFRERVGLATPRGR